MAAPIVAEADGEGVQGQAREAPAAYKPSSLTRSDGASSAGPRDEKLAICLQRVQSRSRIATADNSSSRAAEQRFFLLRLLLQFIE